MLSRSLLERKPFRVVGVGLIGLCGVEVLWIAAIYPLLPTTASGWLVVLASGAAAAAWSVASVHAILWLQRRRSMRWLSNAAAAVVACSLGVGVFLLAAHLQEFVSGNFSYFSR